MQGANLLLGDQRRAGCWSSVGGRGGRSGGSGGGGDGGVGGDSGYAGDTRPASGVAHRPLEQSPTGVAWVPGPFGAPASGSPTAGGSPPSSLSAAPAPAIKKRRNARVRVAELLPSEVYQCPSTGCGKRFAKKYNLKIHLRRHAGALPFVCTGEEGSAAGCGKRFMWQSSFMRHKRSHEKRAAERAAEAAAHAGGLASAAAAAAAAAAMPPGTAGPLLVGDPRSFGGTGYGLDTVGLQPGDPRLRAGGAAAPARRGYLGLGDRNGDGEEHARDDRRDVKSGRRATVRRPHGPPAPAPMPSLLLQAVARMAERFADDPRPVLVAGRPSPPALAPPPALGLHGGGGGGAAREGLARMPAAAQAAATVLGEPWHFPPSLLPPRLVSGSAAGAGSAGLNGSGGDGSGGRSDQPWAMAVPRGSPGVTGRLDKQPAAYASTDGALRQDGSALGFAAPAAPRPAGWPPLWGKSAPPAGQHPASRGGGGTQERMEDNDSSSVGVSSGSSAACATPSPARCGGGTASGVRSAAAAGTTGGGSRASVAATALDRAFALPSPLALSLQSPLLPSSLSPLLRAPSLPQEQAPSPRRSSPALRSFVLSSDGDRAVGGAVGDCGGSAGVADRLLPPSERRATGGGGGGGGLSPLLSALFPPFSMGGASPLGRGPAVAAADSLLVAPWDSEALLATSPLSCAPDDWPAVSAAGGAAFARQDAGTGFTGHPAALAAGLLFPAGGDEPPDPFT